jgi:hypothetical protein
LRYFGNEGGWGFAFYTYSNERYELAVFPSGEFFGPPEERSGRQAAISNKLPCGSRGNAGYISPETLLGVQGSNAQKPCVQVLARDIP